MAEEKIIIPESKDAHITRLVAEKDRPFPEDATLDLWEPFRDPFKVPEWCNQEMFEYAWLDPNDRYRPFEVALEEGYWNIVKRINHPSAPNSAFRSHGAVERATQILVFRPKDLGDRMRALPMQRHLEIAKDRKAGKVGDHYEVEFSEASGDRGSRSITAPTQIFAQEEAGSAKSSEEAATSLVSPKEK